MEWGGGGRSWKTIFLLKGPLSSSMSTGARALFSPGMQIFPTLDVLCAAKLGSDPERTVGTFFELSSFEWGSHHNEPNKKENGATEQIGQIQSTVLAMGTVTSHGAPGCSEKFRESPMSHLTFSFPTPKWWLVWWLGWDIFPKNNKDLKV